MLVYHGTDRSSADSIRRDGIQVTASTGYFGEAFYTTPDADLARSNYAEFSEDGAAGVVLTFRVTNSARYLDLRISEHWDKWRASGRADRCSETGHAAKCRAAGIDAIYDESFGGWAVFNADTLEVKEH